MSANLSATEQLVEVVNFAELPPLSASTYRPHWAIRGRGVYRFFNHPLTFVAAWMLILSLLVVLSLF